MISISREYMIYWIRVWYMNNIILPHIPKSILPYFLFLLPLKSEAQVLLTWPQQDTIVFNAHTVGEARFVLKEPSINMDMTCIDLNKNVTEFEKKAYTELKKFTQFDEEITLQKSEYVIERFDRKSWIFLFSKRRYLILIINTFWRL